MTSAATATAPASTTAPKVADVFVVFGITGDLAKVMTFRSLYRLEQRGLLQCPIVGVAFDDWTVDQLVQRARDSIVGTGEQLDEAVFARFAERLSYVQGDFADDAAYERVAAAVGDAEHPVFYLEIPPFLFGRVVAGPPRRRADDERQDRRREALRARPGVRPRARRRAAPVHRRVAALQDRPLPREDGARGDPLRPVLQHAARAGLEPGPRRVRRDHDGRGLRRGGPGPLLRPGRRAARRRRQPPDAGGRGDGDGGAVARRPGDAEGREGRALQGRRRGRPGALRARPVRRLPRDRRRRRRLDDRDVRGAPARDRELALVGRAVLHPHRQAPPDDADRGPRGLQAPAQARLRLQRGRAEPGRDQARSDGGDQGRRQRAPGGHAGRRPRSRPARHGVRGSGRGAADALRGPAPRGDGRRRHALHAAGRDRGDVAGHAAAPRRAAARPRLRTGLVGARRQPTSSWPASAAGTGPG